MTGFHPVAKSRRDWPMSALVLKQEIVLSIGARNCAINRSYCANFETYGTFFNKHYPVLYFSLRWMPWKSSGEITYTTWRSRSSVRKPPWNRSVWLAVLAHAVYNGMRYNDCSAVISLVAIDNFTMTHLIGLLQVRNQLLKMYEKNFFVLSSNWPSSSIWWSPQCVSKPHLQIWPLHRKNNWFLS